ncbi:hypothetical protein MNBD_PLANCTO02-1288 [hydrothermal vent metagenome]|uniref:DUF997 family protein n=1 Tax=hydrothermal vent metagenome TaxID=652676 RepID=A0A3B1DY23_9ZZZZ
MNQPVTAPLESDQIKLKTLLKNARKEAVVILFIWLVASVWTMLFCYFSGYSGSGAVNRETISLTCGIPTWVFWGVAMPWGVVDICTIWFCLFYMQDDDLGAVQEDALETNSQTVQKEGE